MNHIEAATLRAALPKIEVDLNNPECLLLGCILTDPSILVGAYHSPALLGYIEPDDFKSKAHEWIYQAMIDLVARGIEPNFETVAYELKQRHADGGALPDYNQCVAMGGSVYLTDLYNQVSAPIVGVNETGLEFASKSLHDAYYSFARLVVEAGIERKARDLTGKLANANLEHDIPRMEALQMELDHQIHRNDKDGQGLTVDNGDSLADQLCAWYADPQDVRGYKTGLEELDLHLGGLQPNELVILAGYTGSGKSTLAMQMALSFCEQGAGLIIPTEMSIEQWRLRLLAYVLGTDDETLRKGQHRDLNAQLEANNFITSLPIQWFKAMSPTPTQILTSVRNLRRNGLIDWVIVDGMHDIKAEGDGVYERTNQAISCLHECANLGLIVLATAHLNRGANEEPNIRDLLGTAQIEQKATRILTLYRPGNMVESGEWKAVPNGISPNMAQIRLAKSRFSKAGHVVKLMFGKLDNGQHGFHPVTDPERPPILMDYRMKD